MYTHKMVNGERVELTPKEIAELEAAAATYTPPSEPAMPPAPTKEELLAQLNALAAQIQSLG